MGGLWPVFGLIILTIVWVVLRRVAPRLQGRSTAARALVGAGAGAAMSAVVMLAGVLVAVVSTALGITADTSNYGVAAAAASTMFVTGFIFTPIAAAFGAVLLAVESYRVESTEY